MVVCVNVLWGAMVKLKHDNALREKVDRSRADSRAHHAPRLR